MQTYQHQHEKELSLLPTDYTFQMALNNGDVIALGAQPYNLITLQQFLNNVKNGISDKIRITIFNVDGYPSISILEYDGYSIIFTRRYFVKDDINYITYYGSNILLKFREDSYDKIKDYILVTNDKGDVYVFYEVVPNYNQDVRKNI